VNGLRDYDYAALQQPAQGYLCSSLAVFLANLGEGRVGEQSVLTFCQWSPRHELGAKLIHELSSLVLLVEHMRLHLVHHRRNLHVGSQVYEMVREEVAHSDGTHLSCLVSFFQVTVSAVAVAVGLVEEHQVDVVGLQLAQTLVDALHGLSLAIVGVPVESFIGIRVPMLRKFAKEFTKEAECEEFLHQLPHEYYDENMLHGLLISEVKDYEECIQLTDCFLPFVDNWAVCDIMSPKVFAKYKKELLAKIKTWSKSSHVYTCRFGIGMLMSHYLDKGFKAEYLEIPASVRSEEYYVKMMIAWFFATALAKQWDATIPYIEQRRLAPWTHNKTIQKAIESYRITLEQKEYLRTLKIK
jgi:3-methyladenine DNA glycosylase AlkD